MRPTGPGTAAVQPRARLQRLLSPPPPGVFSRRACLRPGAAPSAGPLSVVITLLGRLEPLLGAAPSLRTRNSTANTPCGGRALAAPLDEVVRFGVAFGDHLHAVVGEVARPTGDPEGESLFCAATAVPTPWTLPLTQRYRRTTSNS